MRIRHFNILFSIKWESEGCEEEDGKLGRKILIRRENTKKTRDSR